MEAKVAREFLPIWSAQKVQAETERKVRKVHIPPVLREWAKKYGLVFALVAVFALYGLGVAKYTEWRVTKEVTARVTAEMQAGFSRYLQQQEEEQAAARFLSGEASLQAAMQEEADALARLLYGYRNNSLRDRKTLIWCVLARVDNRAYPGSVQEVISQPSQWMFYSEQNPIREDDRQLALEQLEAWHGGHYPAGFSSEYIYAEWSQSDIALRNTWEKSSATSWWRFPEG